MIKGYHLNTDYSAWLGLEVFEHFFGGVQLGLAIEEA